MEPSSKSQPVYASFGVTGVPLGRGRVLARSEMTGAAHLLSAAQAEALLSCKAFAPLADHAARLARPAGSVPRPSLLQRARHRLELAGRGKASGGEDASVARLLDAFVRDGLLVSEAAVRGELQRHCEAASPPPQEAGDLTTIGIPTRNRPECLARACAGYLENATRHGRPVRFVIVDDAKEEAARAATCGALRHFADDHNAGVAYMDRPMRAELAEKLADHADVPPEAVRFALLGDGASGPTYGAARNTLLLLTAGTRSVQVDDDTVCRLVRVPTSEDGLVLSSELPQDFWYFERRADVQRYAQPIEADFLGLHERLLGTALPSRLAEAATEGKLGFHDLRYATFQRACTTEARIGVTSAGWYGDVASGSASYRLLHRGDAFRRLIESEEAYRTGMTTREVLRIPSSLAVTGGGTLMTTNLGLDGRRMLPPFMPVMRGEDAVFGQLLKVCFRDVFRGYLPCAILHDPPEPRPVPEVGFHPFTGSSLLANLIAWSGRVPLGDAPQALRTIGHSLLSLSASTDGELLTHVRAVCHQELSFRIQQAERYLNEHPEAPSFWRDDVARYVGMLRRGAAEGRVVFSTSSGESLDRAVGTFKRHLFRFGSLLIHWPEIYAAAKQLRGEDALLTTVALT